jgi:hypothetical protein
MAKTLTPRQNPDFLPQPGLATAIGGEQMEKGRIQTVGSLAISRTVSLRIARHSC